MDKPAGVTSHDVVRTVRRVLGQQQVGHTGTLDPMATGLLVIALGKATRIARFIEASEKLYDGEVTLGVATTTYDAQGEVTESAPVAVSEDQIREALVGLRGEVEQAVPPYSAVKVGGERLYVKARRGEVVETPVRTITVHALEATAIASERVSIRARVSKGTYIRTLAVQIGEALGLPAHLSALRRVAVGASQVTDAVAPEALDRSALPLISIEDALADLPRLDLDDPAAEEVTHGRALDAATVVRLRSSGFEEGDPVRLVAPDGHIWAMAFARAGWDDLQAGARPERPLDYACVLRPSSEIKRVDSPGSHP